MKSYIEGEKVNLTLKLYDSEAARFCRATLFDSNFTLINNYNLTHVINGLYRHELINLSAGSYYVVYEVFKDSGFTNKDKNYQEPDEFISVVPNLENVIIEKADEADGRAI